MTLKSCLIPCTLLGLFLMSTTAFAKPAYKKQFAAYYPGSAPTCTTCHTKSPKLNAYGMALKAEMKGGKLLTPAMFKACDAKAPK